MKTYGFGKPDAVPITAQNTKLAPYFKFYEYQHLPKEREWTVVILENEFIKVWILPEIGGKVWGAVEKSTGNEFLYKNEVVKFRNIAMRGPWTSGGIEFNFGIIGHHPSTATPINYKTVEYEDGSVACIVGNDDLPSNTHWTVEIKLPPKTAYFETNATWYNASPLTESYYNWMTGAARAAMDLEFFIPGNAYVEHNGDAHPWPLDAQGRNLAMYGENNFGKDKSYHIVGAYQNFFGGYYHDEKVGFGQWAPYEEMPGQKLWLWSLARSGGIWEDLLTDTDGQYIEFQAGRLLDQYSPGAVNPISQVGFAPKVMDQWSQIWFPIKEIGGMEAVSREAVLNVEEENGSARVSLNALQELKHRLEIRVNGKVLKNELMELGPMEVASTSVPLAKGNVLEVHLLGTDLKYTNEKDAHILKRPFLPDTALVVSKHQQWYQDALEALEFREYQKARQLVGQLVEEDGSHREALLVLSELEYRRANYPEALSRANAVLRMDTYNARANYLAGISHRALGDHLNALESLGWAARDIGHRSLAYGEMAELYLKQGNHKKALEYGQRALDFNRYNKNALEVLLVARRKEGDARGFLAVLKTLKEFSPLNHFAAVEEQFMEKGVQGLGKWAYLKNELPGETALTTAIRYHELGMETEAMQVLQKVPGTLKNEIWVAYLTHRNHPGEAKAPLRSLSQGSVLFSFPYKRESLKVLQWANRTMDHWKFSYLLAQNYIALDRVKEGLDILDSLGERPNVASFYQFRAAMNREKGTSVREKDFLRALELAPADWKVHLDAIQFYLGNNAYEKALARSETAFGQFPKNDNIGLAHAKALLHNGYPKRTLQVLANVQILPFEHASESKQIYDEAHYALLLEALENNDHLAAKALIGDLGKWPENLGVGKPFDVDERLIHYALAFCAAKQGDDARVPAFLEKVLGYVNEEKDHFGTNALLRLLALRALNRPEDLQKDLDRFNARPKEDQNTKNALALFDKSPINIPTSTHHKTKLMQFFVENPL
ncbi:DUF5107 domain-containing protein [Maribacter sp. 2307ULW6-5]|uniref:DUF5107 domain-containing protein n=1 Tax=Maribacter sp. 2307ULW6-5 TaxID=3386275 RepID=UPI0039BD1016